MQPTRGTLAHGGSEHLKATINQAGRLLKARKYGECAARIAEAEAIAPQDAHVLHLKGLLLFETKRIGEARPLLERAISLRPKDPAMKHNLAAILISQGAFDRAEDLLLQAIDLKPDYMEAFHTLAPIHRFESGDRVLRRMERAARDMKFSPTDGSFLCFALAKAYDDIGDVSRAWKLLEQGNALMPSRYDAEAEKRGVSEVTGRCSLELIAERSRAGHPTPAPIFVVGMPRSGTTLVERLIGEHPQVFAAGELSGIPLVASKMATNLGAAPSPPGHAALIEAAGPDHIRPAAKGYLDLARQDATEWFDRFVDKLPDNSFNLGLIRSLFPNARIVHVMRHPLDVMLSIYFQRFTTLQYAFRPDDIAIHYNNYLQLMAHWRSHLPGGMVEVSYETLVDNTEISRDRLLKALDLDPGLCGAFHKGAKTPPGGQRTASRWQVAQPVHTHSREKWRRYADVMTPLIEAFGGLERAESEAEQQRRRGLSV